MNIRFFSCLLTLFFLLNSHGVYAEALYYATDVGTLETEHSEARSLNQSGAVAGKYTNEGHTVDFIWTPENGLEIITTEADLESYPRINNLNQVVGFIEKRTKSWTGTKVEISNYRYNSQEGFAWRGEPFPRGKGYSYQGFNDEGTLLSINHIDLYQSTRSWAFFGTNMIYFAPYTEEIDYKYASALNNKSQVLVTSISPGMFGTNLLAVYELYIYNLSTTEWIPIADDTVYYGIGLNDNTQVIARDKKGSEGFFWSQDKGMISLGNFIPLAFNNHGYILGKLYWKSNNKAMFRLRDPDGKIIDLSESIDFGALQVKKIMNVWSINDKGQILITAMIEGKTHALLLTPKQ